MLRLSMVAAVAIVALCFAPRPATAREAPWCAVTAIGWGAFSENCSFWSLEACVPEVIAGNRGFCEPNPRYEGPPPESRPKRRVRRR